MPFKNFTDIQVLSTHLEKITNENKALWGKMTTQHMLEHLDYIVKYSYSGVDIPLQISDDKIEKSRIFLHSNEPMPKNFKLKILGDDLPELKNENINQAKDKLMESMYAFLQHFKYNPQFTKNHPIFGKCDFKDWKLIHNKHFTHHFEQFGIL